MNQASCLGLLSNAVLVWNILRIAEIVTNCVQGTRLLTRTSREYRRPFHAYVIPNDTHRFLRRGAGSAHVRRRELIGTGENMTKLIRLAALIFEDERCLVGLDRIDEIIGIIPARRPEKHEIRRYRNRQWNEKERQALRRTGRRQAAGDDAHSNFDDIPRLTDEQLARMVRLGEVRRRVAVSIRLHPRVLDWLKSKGEGHLTRINDILSNLMEAERRTRAGR